MGAALPGRRSRVVLLAGFVPIFRSEQRHLAKVA